MKDSNGDRVNGDGGGEILYRQTSSSSSTSPRCEAYLMTGEKMLLLDHKISPSYAKVGCIGCMGSK